MEIRTGVRSVHSQNWATWLAIALSGCLAGGFADERLAQAAGVETLPAAQTRLRYAQEDLDRAQQEVRHQEQYLKDAEDALAHQRKKLEEAGQGRAE